VQVADDVSDVPGETDWPGWVNAALEVGSSAVSGVVTVRLVGREESAALNQTWRDKAGPTNVLAFPALTEDLPPEEAEIGDLVLCLPVAVDEARAQSKSLVSHLAHLVMHGTLHLIGFDHQCDSEADEMESLEVGLMQKFGFADPYATH